MTVKDRYEIVLDNIKKACERSGRNPEDITLISVTKTHGAELINEAIDAGAKDIGENKAQELCNKYDDVKPVRWHFIGHLQTNKVKTIIDKVVMIHSVDSDKLASEIDKRAKSSGVVMDILVEINIGMEDSKSGATEEEARDLIKKIRDEYQNLRVRGLMCVPPITDNPENSRRYFRKLKDIFESIKELSEDEYFDTLSMGMSGDYEVAIEEGATVVRVGTAIFGAREYR
ncbi:YggS family pyridoxal phosphate-dependent enzyme [Alterileibacterium massiliense]|uniref:YggS family pyridoxal phosphate-dependent enzyme n=1 Tax=Alterileibacterium massiliense TaxID=1870997 RepID=UPI0008DA5644|nr:YggS family pyridoxal phosphate-dependent enzyme [Alterileibacterium massiliense]